MTPDSDHLIAARELPVQAPWLPPSLAARLHQGQWHRNLVGQAGAAVYRLRTPQGADVYLKHGRGEAAQAITDEMVRLRWLTELMPVPALLHFEGSGDEAWLLTGALPGRTAWEWLAGEPHRMPSIVASLAHLMARLHAVPLTSCAFNADHVRRLADARRRLDAGLVDAEDFDEARADWAPEDVWQEMQRLLPLAVDPVVSHGDFSLDNILLDAEGRVTGMIDLGRVGVADRYQDLAILWNCLSEFGPQAQSALFAAYGIEEPDERKLNFHLCLDECF